MSRNFDAIQAELGNFGPYQVRLYIATQLGYLCVAGSMMCTLYDNIVPTDLNCDLEGPDDSINGTIGNTSLISNNQSGDFHSLIMDLGLGCRSKYIGTTLSTAVMSGGVCGAGVWGYIADRWGRKASTVIPMIGCVCFNILIAVVGHYNVVFTALLLCLLGFFGGGYMVTNLVTLLENVGGQFWRLGATSVNGWPFGLMTMALLGFLTKDWRWFHLSLSAIGILTTILLILFVEESPRWLLQHGKIDSAWKIFQKIARINNRTRCLRDLETTIKEIPLHEVNREDAKSTILPDKNYTYIDLFKYRPTLLYLLALFYSWLASSIISYGIYYNLSDMAGNRFLNTFFTGLFKGMTGIIPFAVSRFVGRKPVLLIGASIAGISSWIAVTVFFVSTDPSSNPILTIFSVIGAGAIDPIWKVNHLYSTELFPTVVRNMARAVCNIGSRVGSVIAPQVAHTRHFFAPLPFIIFGTLSIFHVLISFLFLPETKGRPLPEKFEQKEDENIQLRA